MKTLRALLLPLVLAALAAGIAPSARRPREAAVYRSTWCPSPQQRAELLGPLSGAIVTDDGAEVEEVPMAKGGPTP